MENNMTSSDWVFIAGVVICTILARAEYVLTRKIRLNEIRKQRAQRLWPIATVTIRCDMEEAC